MKASSCHDSIKLSHSLAAWHILVLKRWISDKTQETNQMNFSVEKAVVLLSCTVALTAEKAQQQKLKSISRWTVVWTYHFTWCVCLPSVSFLCSGKIHHYFKIVFQLLPMQRAGPWKAIVMESMYFISNPQNRQSGLNYSGTWNQ